jgi:hypothetical protein
VKEKNYLSSGELQLLREKKVLAAEEVAFWTADILVAENVVTNEKRAIVDGAKLLNESPNRSLLKG